MILQSQPNRASCLATAFAMCLDIPVQEIFNDLGHDGTEIAFTNLEVPRCYRGFHSTELIEYSFRKGFSVLELVKVQENFHGAEKCQHCGRELVEGRSFNSRYDIFKYLGYHDVVLTNGYHAVAWDCAIKRVYDPCGKFHDNFPIDILYNDFDIFYIFN